MAGLPLVGGTPVVCVVGLALVWGTHKLRSGAAPEGYTQSCAVGLPPEGAAMCWCVGACVFVTRHPGIMGCVLEASRRNNLLDGGALYLVLC